MTIGNLNANTSPSYVADASTGRLAIGGVEMGNTGWRQVAPENGWTVRDGIRVRRVGTMVFVSIDALISGDDAATSPTIYTLPANFWPMIDVKMFDWVATGNLVYIQTNGTVNINRPLTEAITNIFSFPTSQPWPATLPGTQVTPPLTG